MVPFSAFPLSCRRFTALRFPRQLTVSNGVPARYIWSNTIGCSNLWILSVVAVSMIPYFRLFDLPKQIVNGPIQGSGFEGRRRNATFMRLVYTFPVIGVSRVL